METILFKVHLFSYCDEMYRQVVIVNIADAVMLSPQECGKCQLPGCEEHRYQDPANCRVHHFCSRSHASQARAKGQVIGIAEQYHLYVTTSVIGTIYINIFNLSIKTIRCLLPAVTHSPFILFS